MEQVLMPTRTINLLLKKHKHLLETVLYKSRRYRPAPVKIKVEQPLQPDGSPLRSRLNRL